MKQKRITIYDIARELNIHASYVSRALNDHPSVSEEMVEKVKRKALELNYRHNSFAANLRQRQSKIVGVILPKINGSFFSNIISGIEFVCSQNKHHVIICQSHESYKKELEAIDTLIEHNVDCILISLSTETESAYHLKQIIENGISLVQLDRFNDSISSHIVENNNKEIAFEAVRHLVNQKYKRIAYIGGPAHLKTYSDRKQGYLAAIGEFKMPDNETLSSSVALSSAKAKQIAFKLLSGKQPPDAFFTSSDYGALGVLQAAKQLKLEVPSQLGIVGFQNEEFTKIISPTITTIDQKSIDIGKVSAGLYFKNLNAAKNNPKRETIKCELIRRQSSQPKKMATVDGSCYSIG